MSLWSGFKDRFPEHPTWRMVIFTLALFAGLCVAMGAFAVDMTNKLEDINAQQDAGRERGFINRAVGCMSLIIDNDRTFPLTGECTDSNVAAYYPPQVCAALPVVVEGCGSKVTEAA